MVAKGDKEIEEELSAAVEHLQLHGPATPERGAGADDEGEVVSPEL